MHIIVALISFSEFSKQQSEFLVDLFGEFVDDVGPAKKFGNKKKMFAAIATKLYEKFHTCFTSEQCNQKYNNIAKAVRAANAQNAKSGSNYIQVPFQQ